MLDGDDWDVRIADDAVIVELPRRLSLDTAAGERLCAEFRSAVSAADVDRVVSIVAVEHPLSAECHRLIRTGARVAADNGVTEWHVVAEHERKGAAIAREITGLDTAVFADEREDSGLLA
jgi:cyclopropane fatty-acyl-phospholipid synthase-like methyltransferase